MIAELPHTDGSAHFPSLAALKTANNDLIKRRSTEDDRQVFLNDVAAFMKRGIATGAILNLESERWTCQSILDYWANFLDRNDRLTAPDETLLAPFDPELAIDIPESKCPYVGLEAFREHKQLFFFGRQKLIEELLLKISNTRCLAIVGSSGSGKSSLVLAGVVPALKAGALERSQKWQYLPPIVPGLDPLANLASLVSRPTDDSEETWIAEQVRGLKQSNSHLLKLINGHKFEAASIVVDQFEEIFTLTSDETVQKAFLANLASLIEFPDLRHTLIFTMRSEFETYIAKTPAFEKYFTQAIRVTPLSAVEVREAIQKPAELVGLKFEEGIIDELVNETIGEPAGLPLLQFTLLKLWKMREHDLITLQAFKRLGSCREALTTAADEFYNTLTPIDQRRVKWILLRLVRPAPGGGLEVFNNRVPRAHLYKSSDDREHIDRVLDGLIDAGLIRETEGAVASGSKIEIAHEALVRHWRRLVGWLDEERVNIVKRLSLSEAAKRWDLSGRDSLNLLRGAQLDEALRFDELNALEEEFVKRSHNRKLWSKRFSYITLAVGIVGLITVATVYIVKGRAAAAKERKASSQALAAKSLLNKDRLDLALLLSIEAYRTDPTPEARGSLFALLFGPSASNQITYLRSPSKLARKLSLTGDSRLTAINSDGTVSIWNTKSPELEPTSVDAVPNAAGYSLSANANLAAISTFEGEIIFLDPSTGQRRQTISTRKLHNTEYANELCLSGDGTILAAIDGNRYENVQLWDVRTGTELTAIENDSFGAAFNLALNESGAVLAFSYTNFETQQINIWDVPKKKLRRIVKVGSPQDSIRNLVTAVAISPDGKFLAWAVEDKISVRETAGGRFMNDFSPVANQNITDLFFSADGKKIVATSENGSITINEFERNSELPWVAESSPRITVQAPPGVSATTLSTDEKILVASTAKGAVILWQLDKASKLTTEFEASKIQANDTVVTSDGRRISGVTTYKVAVTNDGSLIAGSVGDTIVFWDASTHKPTGRTFSASEVEEIAKENEGQKSSPPQSDSRRYQVRYQFIKKLIFSDDNKYLAAEYGNGMGILWDMATGRPRILPTGEGQAVFALSVSPDGRSVAWIGWDKEMLEPLEYGESIEDEIARDLVIWNFTTNDPPKIIVQKNRSLAGLAFSSDGKILATSDKNGSLTLWDPKNGHRMSELHNPKGQLQRPETPVTNVALAFTPDNKILTVATPGQSITFWDMTTNQRLDDFVSELGSRVTRMTFNTDSRANLMTASSELSTKIELWDTNTRRPLGTITSPAFVTDGTLSRNGKVLILAGRRLVSWNVSIDDWLTVACQIANRNLTWPEWRDYIGGEVQSRKTCTN